MRAGNLVLRRLDGPPAGEFDCGREAQNAYFHECAWRDQAQWLSMTYLLLAEGTCAAYATAVMDSLELGTREKRFQIHYRRVGALKLAQLGVDLRFQQSGLGKLMVGTCIALARRLSQHAGCRYVGLDAQPDLVGWYEGLGFTVNKLMQKQRVEAAAIRGISDIAVSMRFDTWLSAPGRETG